jgi:hypothetical protein
LADFSAFLAFWRLMVSRKSTAKARKTPRKREGKHFGCGYADPG